MIHSRWISWMVPQYPEIFLMVSLCIVLVASHAVVSRQIKTSYFVLQYAFQLTNHYIVIFYKTQTCHHMKGRWLQPLTAKLARVLHGIVHLAMQRRSELFGSRLYCYYISHKKYNHSYFILFRFPCFVFDKPYSKCN